MTKDQDTTRAENDNQSDPHEDLGCDGVLIVDGMQPLEAVRIVERFGGCVYFAREATDGSSVLDVHMDTPTANAVALEMIDVPVRYVPIDVAHKSSNRAA